MKNEKNINKKKFLIGAVTFIAVVALIISFFVLRNREKRIEENKLQIEKNLSDLENLENEVYFNSDYIASISDMKEASEKAVENNDLKELVSINKEIANLYSKAEQEIARYNELYTVLQDEMSRTVELQNNYFAKDYDTSKLNQTKDRVESALSKSDYLEYEQLYKEFSGQNDALRDFIDNALNSTYSVETNTNISKDYPFAVLEEDIPLPWSFKPITKQTKNHPTWIIANEADVLDEPPYANLFIDDTSAEYTFDIHQAETKEITVQDESGSLQKALVNTEVNFDMKEGYSIDQYTALNERPAYLFKDKNEKILLALKNYDGEDYYVLYSPQ